MKLKQSILILLLTYAAVASAQNAREILDKASDTYHKTGGVAVNFTLNSTDSKAKDVHSYDGRAYMKGDKFKIEIPGATTWFDGKTQWVYIKDTEEVNVSTPSGEELQGISPSILFSIYKKGYNLSYKGEKRVGGKTIQKIELTPQKKKADISKIVVEIDKATNTFSSISITDKSGLNNTLVIKKYKPESLVEAIFIFNKNEYPKAEIVDLR